MRVAVAREADSAEDRVAATPETVKKLKALGAEGIPCYTGYTPLNKAASLTNTLSGKAYKYIYSEKDLAGLNERNQCPKNDQLCEEAVWIPQTALLGDTESMDHIVQAIRKIQKQANLLL